MQQFRFIGMFVVAAIAIPSYDSKQCFIQHARGLGIVYAAYKWLDRRRLID
jgi:hypothetical protein